MRAALEGCRPCLLRHAGRLRRLRDRREARAQAEGIAKANSQQRRACKTTSSQATPHWFAASQWVDADEGCFGSTRALPRASSARQKVLRKQTVSLQRRERRMCATNCRERVQQSTSQDAQKQTKFAQAPVRVDSTSIAREQHPIRHRCQSCKSSASSRPTIVRAKHFKLEPSFPRRLRPMTDGF